MADLRAFTTIVTSFKNKTYGLERLISVSFDKEKTYGTQNIVGL